MQVELSKRRLELLLQCVQFRRRAIERNTSWAKSSVMVDFDAELDEIEKILTERLTPLPSVEDEEI